MEQATVWLKDQEDLIEDGNCRCRMKLSSCLERQRQYPQTTNAKSEGPSEIIRDKFVLCVPCKHFRRVKWDRKRVNQGFRARPRLNAEQLEVINRAKRKGKAASPKPVPQFRGGKIYTEG